MMNYSRRRLDRLEKTPTPTLTMMTKNRVARRRGRGPASARASCRAHRSAAVCPHPPGRSRSRLARRRPDARASRAGETRRRRGARAGRASVRRRGRATVALDASRESPINPSLPRPSSRARVRPTRRRVSIGAPRRAYARWRRAAGARRVVESRRPSRTRARPVRSVGSSSHYLSLYLFFHGTASRELERPASPRADDSIASTPNHHSTCSRPRIHTRARSRRRPRAPPVAGTRTGTHRDGRIRFMHDASSTPDPPSTHARPRAIETDVFSLSLSFFSTPPPPPIVGDGNETHARPTPRRGRENVPSKTTATGSP